MSTVANIDLAAIEAKLAGMSKEDLMKQVLDIRVRQKVQQKKYHNTEAAKNYRQKRYAEQKALLAKARELGLIADIDKQAEELASAKIADDEAISDLVQDGE